MYIVEMSFNHTLPSGKKLNADTVADTEHSIMLAFTVYFGACQLLLGMGSYMTQQGDVVTSNTSTVRAYGAACSSYSDLRTLATSVSKALQQDNIMLTIYRASDGLCDIVSRHGIERRITQK